MKIKDSSKYPTYKKGKHCYKFEIDTQIKNSIEKNWN